MPSSKLKFVNSTIAGIAVSIHVDSRYLSAGKVNAEGETYVRGIIAKVPQLHALIVKDLLRIYHASWLDDDHHRLDRAGFIAKVTLHEISLLEEGFTMVYFDDGDLFGGHTIACSVSKTRLQCNGIMG
jgi:hypothetical protein